MVSSDLGSVDLTDLSTGHTNGTHGHDVMNDWIDIATRPGSVRSSTHSSAGTLSINADMVGGGHVAIVTVAANITGVTITNITNGLPFMLILVGNGVGSFTADLSTFKINAIESLSSSVAIGPSDAIAISFLKLPSGNLWAPGGLMVYSSASTLSGITPIGNGHLYYAESYTTTKQIPIPSGVAAGDFLEIVVQTQLPSDPGAPTAPGGWTQRFSNTPSAGYVPRVTKFYKYASGSEGGTNITLTWGTSVAACGGSQVWRGVHGTTPYDNSASSASMISGTGSPNPPAVTAVNADAMAVVYAGGNKTGGLSCTPPSGYTKTMDQSAYNRSMVMAYKQLSATGSEDPGAFTWAVENSTVYTDILRAA